MIDPTVIAAVAAIAGTAGATVGIAVAMALSAPVRADPLPDQPAPPPQMWETVTRRVETNVRAAAIGRDVVVIVSDQNKGTVLAQFTVHECVMEDAGWVRGE